MDREVFDTSTIDSITGKRRDGNTTRQIDAAIQAIFKGNIVKVHSHHGISSNYNEELLNKILHRLELEHDLMMLLHSKELNIDRNKCTITLTEVYYIRRKKMFNRSFNNG